ncbi:MAG: bifunctional diaminohydroxyphosphoribosylaminopyrimidine deaminase/5-amino-6-(5-phosphoribosylamino)uracil reductase RibD [Candidatus Eisenbacteria bacterium]
MDITAARGGAHAEVIALGRAKEEARGASLFVTLEPCCHHGRTGPCTERILEAGISEVVVAMVDPFPPVAGKGIARLRRAGVRVRVGEGEEEARRLNEAYLFRLREGRPWVDLKLAATLDGKIADGSGRSRWITGEGARRRVHDLRWGSDGILVGVGTVLRDNPRLTARKGNGRRAPLRIVLDSMLRTPPGAALLMGGDPERTVIACRRDAPASRRRALERAGAVLWTVPGLRAGGVSPTAVLRRLAGAGVNRLLVEGGGGGGRGFSRPGAGGTSSLLHVVPDPRIREGLDPHRSPPASRGRPPPPARRGAPARRRPRADSRAGEGGDLTCSRASSKRWAGSPPAGSGGRPWRSRWRRRW